ncbi:hypothetical protein DY000_02039171 [Brassica cretica]|uniref:Uncharacterized protein n=1 Tax=Brassica cretica TaxID=69181 RepID=A0ABQ7B5W3_BRACR|nr:hypothetical protein DY000_02039171 [Brassica cretica]
MPKVASPKRLTNIRRPRTDFTGGGPWDRTRSTSKRGPRASPSGDPEAGVLPGV